ncbi:ATP-binding cassette sub-family B member 6 [Condylostylus longicornis]|uniref:ATP-binding cassette sub-family B member 6 n=1 Tax=Condylostylus longicornis TaxID=2530218 RepID=UPI00244E43F0|nr:ATP-binding cassette sub-family B member 6 [Condylostylus longicornis]XP_055382828.1 ATP-binding cassette sub-family B member 6 [Condylostylus longicornis]
MLYCPPNVTLSQFWVNHGISHCFMDTVFTSITAGFLIIFGTLELLMYWKYATPITDTNQIPRSKLYKFQIFLLFLFPLLVNVRFVLNGFVYKNAVIYGFMIFSTILTTISFSLSVALVRKERYYLLPSVPTRGHGFILLLFWTMLFIVENLSFVNMRHEDWWFNLKTTKDKIEMSLFIIRYTSALLIFILGLKAPGIMVPIGVEELLLPPDENTSAFRNAFKKLRKLFPYIWPKKDFLLQSRVLICILLLISGRVIKLFLPLYRKAIVDSLTIAPIYFRWDFVLIFVALSFLQGSGTGSMGLLNNLRQFLWIRVQQYTTREIQVDLFRHLHNLSLRWHLQRKTGEVLRIMDRGTDSIDNLLNYILFSIAPTIADLIVAVIFFIVAFNGWFGLIVFVTMTLYIVSTIVITEWRTKYQRSKNLAENAARARSVDSLLNFETVKYYGAEKYEVDSFREAIEKFQVEEWRTLVTLNILNTAQNIILCSGLLAGSMLCVYDVATIKNLTVGDYVLFISYLVELYMPLNWFGTYYRAIQKNFIDMENMFDLLREEEEVFDAPCASLLQASAGKIEFSNVSFGYSPDRIVLKNVSFCVPAGKTVAIVGPSGAGKSTIVRLLFRFYDISSGAILIDGQNVKMVTQESLRKSIGVVPQDTVLFNNTIYYNIEYGRIGAEPDAVFSAARSADIHDKIQTFPDRYDTQVGERGLRLSGGEKQRVAIARTLLKSPIIVLLDEATSALDTHTERNIQSAIAQVCANRTTIIIAHRLSTIIHADEILVLKDGSIVERGKHDELLSYNNGVYRDMWEQQLKNLDAENRKQEIKTTSDDKNDKTTENEAHGHH